MQTIHSRKFTTEPLTELLAWGHSALADSDTITLEVLNPDLARGSYAGERVVIGDISYLHRSYKAWSDLGEILFCRMLTPEKVSEHTVRITFEKLDQSDSFHLSVDKEEKYGTASRFAVIHKNEEPAFLNAYLRALRSVKVGEKKRILNLGINTGDEFDLTPDGRAAVLSVGLDRPWGYLHWRPGDAAIEAAAAGLEHW